MTERNRWLLLGSAIIALLLAATWWVHARQPEPAELSETLAWMDNTYNPHDHDITGAFGHGRVGWYAPLPNSNRPADEYLVSGHTETFTHDGCQMTLHTQQNPAAYAYREVYGSFSSTFNLRDINPQSIKLSTYSHTAGFRCEDYDSELRQIYQMHCDFAEIVFSTRNEAPLIDEETHTIFAKLQGSDHESQHKSKGAQAVFEVDDVEYAGRFAKAFRHAVELCGGKPEPF